MLEHLAWYAVQVHTRYEKQCETILVDKGYEIFLPTYMKRKLPSQFTCEVPLFPGYLFCRFTANVTGKIVTTPGVLRIVSNGNVPAHVDDSEIARVKQITQSSVAKMPWRYLPAGCRVRIENGPLAGVEGFLEEDSGCSRLVVSISMLCRSVAAVLDPSTILTPLSCKRPGYVTNDERRFAMKLAAGM